MMMPQLLQRTRMLHICDSDMTSELMLDFLEDALEDSSCNNALRVPSTHGKCVPSETLAPEIDMAVVEQIYTAENNA
jgi:hypothetical protein